MGGKIKHCKKWTCLWGGYNLNKLIEARGNLYFLSTHKPTAKDIDNSSKINGF
jgi:hypothetical protein